MPYREIPVPNPDNITLDGAREALDRITLGYQFTPEFALDYAKSMAPFLTEALNKKLSLAQAYPQFILADRSAQTPEVYWRVFGAWRAVGTIAAMQSIQAEATELGYESSVEAWGPGDPVYTKLAVVNAELLLPAQQ